MNHLHGYSRLDLGGVFTSPAPEKVPGSQEQMFGNQQPDADQVAQDLIAEQLAHLPLEAERISRFLATGLFGALGVDQQRLGRGERDVELFF